MNNLKLIPLEDRDKERFILDNQEAFNYGALEEFGRRDDHFEEDEQIISRETIERLLITVRHIVSCWMADLSGA